MCGGVPLLPPAPPMVCYGVTFNLTYVIKALILEGIRKSDKTPGRITPAPDGGQWTASFSAHFVPGT